MAYTPINWAENLDVDATKLDKMDNQIDTNEQRLTDIDNKATGTVTDNLQGQIDTNEQRLTDIDNKATGTVTDNLQGQIDTNGNRITNLEDYIVGNTTIFQSLSKFTITSDNYVTVKEILVGKSGSARLTFEMSSITVGFGYRILVDGSEVANGSHGGTTDWISYTEDISFQAGSNIKVQVASEFQDRAIYFQNFRFKIGNQSDMILEL